MVLLLLALPLLVAAAAIEAADWVAGLPPLQILAVVPLIFWALLARSRVPWWAAHPVALVLGVVATFVLGAFTLTEASGPGDLAGQLGNWFGAAGGEGQDKGAVFTGVFLMAVTLLMSHAAVWLVYRRSAAVLPILPGLGVLLVVLTFLPSDYYWYFFMYLLASAPLIAYRQSRRWIGVGRSVWLLGTVAAGAVVMGIALVPAWRAPAPEGILIPLAAAFEEPWDSVRDRWSDLFYGVPDRKSWPSFTPPDDLPFSGSVTESSKVLFEVDSPKPYRWRMQVYETYTSTGWFSEQDAPVGTLTETAVHGDPGELSSRQRVEVGVQLRSRSKNLVSAGDPLSANIPSYVELSPSPRFEVFLDGPQASYIPQDARRYRTEVVDLLKARTLGRARTDSAGYTPKLGLLWNLGFRRVDAGNGLATNGSPSSLVIERAFPNAGPALALVGERTLLPHKRYQTVGSVSTASPAMLRASGRDYPNWVTDRYLQLPADFSEPVKALALDLTKDSDNPYDMAEDIARYLLTIPYSLEFAEPAPGQDWVEFFLFEHQRGYCQNYASAMITMLRSLDIPARLAVGFAPGVWVPDKRAWEVQLRNYHAWPEVYFQDYGWVEFEPTPPEIQPSLQYLGIEMAGAAGGSLDYPTVCDIPALVGLLELCDNVEGGASDTNPLLDELPEEPPALAEDLVGPEGPGGVSWLWTVVGLGTALAIVVPAGLATYVRWGVSQVGYVTATYAFMRFLGRLAGVGARAQDTPWEYGARLSRALPTHRESISSISRGFADTRYGPTKSVATERVTAVRNAWRSLRRALLARAVMRLVRLSG